MGLTLSMTGDWQRAESCLHNLSIKMYPAFVAQLKEDGEYVLEKLQGHIDSQDLGWTPLSPITVELKGGDTTIMVETGDLRGSLSVVPIKSSKNGSTIFVGASNAKTHNSGLRLDTLMIWLEYGTDKMPPRPLMQPTYEEVKDVIIMSWKALFAELVKGG